MPVLSWGQGNLVPNSSFEEMVSCPTMAGQWWNTDYWMNPNDASPDYFHVCNPPIYVPVDNYFPHLGVPANTFGNQEAQTGEAYMGAYLFHRNNTDKGEYIQVELTESLIEGVRYLVGFHVSLADDSNFALSTIGAFLSEEQISAEGYARFLEYHPQVENPYGQTLTDKENWVLIEDTFSSRYGGERFLTIGNFRTDLESDTVHQDTVASGNRYAYYYIDDVSVIALDSIPNSIAEPATELALTLTVWPNPATSLLHIRSGLPLARLRLLDLSGRAVHAQEAQGTTHTIPLHTLPAGLYLLEATDPHGRRAVQKMVVQQ